MKLKWNKVKLKGIVILFILSLLGFGCGKPVRETGEFEPYLASFEADATSVGKNVIGNYIRIYFSEMEPQKLAICTLTLDVPTITVNAPNWKKLTEVQRQLVMYHEFGHCLLRKNHDDGHLNLPNQRSRASIMNSHPLELNDFRRYKADYLNELFDFNSGNSL